MTTLTHDPNHGLDLILCVLFTKRGVSQNALYSGWCSLSTGRSSWSWWCHQMETCYWPFVRGIHWSPMNSPHNGRWRRALMFYLIYARTNGWVNNGDAGDLRRHRAHYDVTVMGDTYLSLVPSGCVGQGSGTVLCILRSDHGLRLLEVGRGTGEKMTHQDWF